MNNKEYTNVFAKICEHHNNDIVPILKQFNLSTVKVKPRRILNLRDTLEVEENIILSMDLFTEYLILNNFIIPYLNQSEYKNCLNLIQTKSKDNVFIGINALYILIETKKSEIKEKLNE